MDARNMPGMKPTKQENASDNIVEEIKKAPALPPVVTLKLLIEEGMLTPGTDVLSLEYKGFITSGSLIPDGRIEYDGNLFESPSAFSVFLKRQTNPDRKADDGWKTIKYKGMYLEHYKQELLTLYRKRDGLIAPPSKRRAAKKKLAPGGIANTPMDAPPSSSRARKRRASEDAEEEEEDDDLADISAQLVKTPWQEMVVLQQYCGPKGTPPTGPHGAQPFRLQVSPLALAMMDLHAHMDRREINGLLAGSWDDEAKVLQVERALPVRELQAGPRRFAVEMCSDSVQDAFNLVEGQWKMQIVGRYQSHPGYSALPSRAEVLQQMLAQQEHQEEWEDEPFVAALLAPETMVAAGGGRRGRSDVAWFHVVQEGGNSRRRVRDGKDPMEQGCKAMALRQDPYPRTITYPFVAKWLLQYVCKQLQNRPLRATAHQFFIPPRGSTPLLELQWQGSQTRTSKLIESVTSWLQHDLPPPELLELEQKLWTWLYTVCCRPAGNSSSNSSSSEADRLVEEAPPPPRNKGGRPRKDQQQAQQKEQQKAQQQAQQAPAPMPMPAAAPPPHGAGYPPGYPPAYPGHYPGAPPSVAYDYSQHPAHMMYKPPAGYPGAQPGPMPGPHPHAPAPWPAAYSQPYPGYAPPAAAGPAPGGPMYQSSMAPPVSRQMYAGHPGAYGQPPAGAAGGAAPQQQPQQQAQQAQQQGQWHAADVAPAGV